VIVDGGRELLEPETWKPGPPLRNSVHDHDIESEEAAGVGPPNQNPATTTTMSVTINSDNETGR
jgi:hypothetical protein